METIMICKIDMGQSYLLPIWVVIAMIAYNEKNKLYENR